MVEVVAVYGVRTPIGRFGGSLRNESVHDLGACTIGYCVEQAVNAGVSLSEVVLGCCRQAGNGINPARTAAVKGGVSISTPAHTVNMACVSGMKAMMLAAQSIRLEASTVVIAGGMESMSTIPYLLKGYRWEGFKMGDRVLEDGWSDNIDPLTGYGMGQMAENLVAKYDISRVEMDEFALESHRKAAKAWGDGRFDNEVVPYEVPGRGKDATGFVFSKDECIRPASSLEELSELPSVFKADGDVTAGNSSSLADGAVAFLMTSRETAARSGFRPLFSVVSSVQVACEPAYAGEGPASAMDLVLKKAGMNLADIDILEVNEAFAAQVIANERAAKWNRDKLNVFGGAIALGHPTGISGARVVLTLYSALRAKNKEIGLAAVGAGGGVATAMIIRRES